MGDLGQVFPAQPSFSNIAQLLRRSGLCKNPRPVAKCLLNSEYVTAQHPFVTGVSSLLGLTCYVNLVGALCASPSLSEERKKKSLLFILFPEIWVDKLSPFGACLVLGINFNKGTF